MDGNFAHSFGAPVRVMHNDDKGQIIVHTTKLTEMLMHPDVQNRKLMALSVIGAFRKGKSFFLDYCLRYLYANVSARFNI